MKSNQFSIASRTSALEASLEERGRKNRSSKKQNWTLELNRHKKILIIFECALAHIPSEIQVLPANTQPIINPNNNAGIRFESVMIDLAGFLCRCSVDSIMVLGHNEHCQVFVNANVTDGKRALAGFNHWEGPYEVFVRRMLEHSTWRKGIVRCAENVTSLVLRKKELNIEKTVIRFAIVKTADEKEDSSLEQVTS